MPVSTCTSENGTPVDRFALKLSKDPGAAKELVLFLTHAPSGKIKPHVPPYIQSFRKEGFTAVAVVVADDLEQISTEEIAPHCDGLILRENGGYDFGGWAHALQHLDLSETKTLVLANDSLVGPLNDADFSTLIGRIRASNANLVGMTDSNEIRYHFQSYLIAAKNEGVSCLSEFLGNVTALTNKQEVINTYETRLRDAFVDSGLKTEALFPVDSDFNGNSTINHWQNLVETGFPFIKTVVLQALPRDDWKDLIIQGSLSIDIVDKSLVMLGGGTSVLPLDKQKDIEAVAAAARAMSKSKKKTASLSTWQSDKPLKNALKYRFYKTMASITRPISPSASSRYEFRAKRRNPEEDQSAPSAAPSPRSLAKVKRVPGNIPFAPEKPCVLIVSHEASRSGAPILAQNVAQTLSADFNVTVLSLVGGELIDSFAKSSEQVYEGNRLETRQSSYGLALSKIVADRKFDFAVVNSIQSRGILEDLVKLDIPSVLLLHEFSSYISDPAAFTIAINLSNEVVFSTRLTLENAMISALPDYTPFMHTIPQGKCEVPLGPSLLSNRQDEVERLRAVMAPEIGSESRETFTVLGAGRVEYRKGVDLFIEIAARIANNPEGSHVRFVWIGNGFEPAKDFQYSAFLADQIKRAGLDGKLSILAATSEIDAAYEMADVLLLSSRLDPLPNVAIDAMCKGTPVLSFAEASGISDLLIDADLADDCVAGYMNTSQMAEKILRLANSSDRLNEVGQQSHAYAAKTFDLTHYTAQLARLGDRAAKRLTAKASDIAEIAEAESFAPWFYNFRDAKSKSRIDMASDYIRVSHMPGVARKPEPGFNPFVYAQRRGSAYDGTTDPYADFLRNGRPKGAWLQSVIHSENSTARATNLKVALHIHAYFTDDLLTCVQRIERNDTLPDLYVSVRNESAQKEVQELLQAYKGVVATVDVVPNIGRDIGPFLTHFAQKLVEQYDIIGHVHLKQSAHVGNRSVVDLWNNFLMENVLGGPAGGAMIDLAMSNFEVDDRLGLIHPDDPHLIGWTRNRPHGDAIARKLGHDHIPQFFNFPAGTMFWMRSEALAPFLDISLGWGDYPAEPIQSDGTMLHALERLFGVVPALNGWNCAVTCVQGVSR
ncbi:rhamnan synthesis F family protein [Meridianimarinicoccus aquatilis]|uniref:Glycosyltransferase n=1 Tax=Meridianimarinicoccus aquatilis TaxID=2552766 RepID=A0A4V6PPH4_9RHOB|nr:rhamnan synthesis F family protein [Fluviibacterium aquatile]TDL90439.1 glycosyltransferase [Fluviibacterium aquatile]